MRKLSSLISVALLSFAFAAVGCATSEGTDDELSDAQSDATSPGKIDLVQSNSQWRFKVISGNGRALLQSEAYSTRTAALNGVLSVLENGVDPAMYQMNEASNGGFNLRLVANTKILASTQVYSTKSTATRAITSCVRALETYLDRREGNTTGARVQVYELEDGSFVAHVYASNGHAILHSEKYSSEAAAWNGAFAMQDAAKLATGFTVGTTSTNQFYFTLRAANGEAVGNSELYSTRAGALAAIESVKATLANVDLI